MVIVNDIPFDMSTPAPRESETQYYSESMPDILMRDYVSMYNIKTSINNCMLCPLNEYNKPFEFIGGRNEMKHLMIIGEDPTDVLPQFSNGAMIHELISRFDINRDYIHFTSLVKCIGSTHYTDCHHHLISEILAIAPKVIIALGYNVGSLFMQHIAEKNNQQLKPGSGYTLENGSDMIVVYHPKEIVTYPQSMQELNSHLNMAFTHLNNKLMREA